MEGRLATAQKVFENHNLSNPSTCPSSLEGPTEKRSQNPLRMNEAECEFCVLFRVDYEYYFLHHTVQEMFTALCNNID